MQEKDTSFEKSGISVCITVRPSHLERSVDERVMNGET
jgi:hypothetical protein